MAPGIVADDQAQQLAELIQRRRAAGRPRPVVRHIGRSAALLHPAIAGAAIAGPAGFHLAAARALRRPGRYRRASPQPSPSGELAVLKVISDEWLAHGACDRSLNELAARAGVCRFAGQAGGQARRAGWPDHGTAPAAIGPQAPHQHHPHHPRRMARLAATRAGARAYAINACNRAKPIFAEARGVQKNPPRSQVLQKSGSERVDKTVEEGKSDRR